MTVGSLVKVRGYGGEDLIRRVIGETDEVLIVCLEEEYQASRQERREPVGVGFNKKYLVAVLRQTDLPSGG